MKPARRPLLVIHDTNESIYGTRFPTGKCLASSLQRSLYTGRILVLRAGTTRLFRLPRIGIEELVTPTVDFPEKGHLSRQHALDTLSAIHGSINAAADQWVIVADAVGLAMRNIDHLLVGIASNQPKFAKSDFLWTKVEIGTKDCWSASASPGFWAVRGKHYATIVDGWRSFRDSVENMDNDNPAIFWNEFVRGLQLRKRPFEKGEVYAPQVGAVDWEAVSNAAFVTVPDWPEKEQWKFLQALYFGTYFGDETGLMLNILDP